MNESNQEKKIILFSTRFLEDNDYLFCGENYDPQNIKSDEYINFFLSVESLPGEIKGYFNHINCYESLRDYKDAHGNPLMAIDDRFDETQRQEIQKKLVEFVSSDDEEDTLADYVDDVFLNTEEGEYKSIKLIGGQRQEEVEKKSEDLYKRIIEYEGKSINKDVILNTDFGKAVDKRTIDRRFKIYKLKTEKSKKFPNIPVYAVWCLSVGKKETAEDWYKALYKELKFQLGDDEFGKIDEILYFLHDGDIDAKKPFDVIKYKETNAEFSFLDENKRLSVAIFDHSNSLVARSLRTSDIDEAIGIAMAAMESGGKRAFLYKLSDCIARWTETGKEEYKKETTKDKLDRFPDITLKYTSKDGIPDDVSVFDIYADVKQQIDILENRL